MIEVATEEDVVASEVDAEVHQVALAEVVLAPGKTATKEMSLVSFITLERRVSVSLQSRSAATGQSSLSSRKLSLRSSILCLHLLLAPPYSAERSISTTTILTRVAPTSSSLSMSSPVRSTPTCLPLRTLSLDASLKKTKLTSLQLKSQSQPL